MIWNPITVAIAQKLNTYTSAVNSPPCLPGNESKRKVLVVHCHPLKDSFSNAVLGAVVTGLKFAGHETRTRRLYLTGDKTECYAGNSFPPTLTGEERAVYHDSHRTAQLETTEGTTKLKGISKEVREAIQDLRWCDSLVLVYPTWWFNFPAVLKGYLDRVMLPGVAFKLPPTYGSDAAAAKAATSSTGLLPGLTNITKIGVVTTYGASRLTVAYAGDNPRRFLSRAFRPLCSPGCQLLWHGMYDMNISTPLQRQAFLEEVKLAYSTF